MGVLGLTPFIQKTCPEVIKRIPNRLRGLAGKKLVIDGTLITQRLHFAPSPHRYRHVLGWYRLAKELADSGVSAVCVFDGKERNKAKAAEAQRRREVRKVAVSRGTLESDRLRRLQKLSVVVERLKGLEQAERQRIVGRLTEELVPEEFVPGELAPEEFDFAPPEGWTLEREVGVDGDESESGALLGEERDVDPGVLVEGLGVSDEGPAVVGDETRTSRELDGDRTMGLDQMALQELEDYFIPTADVISSTLDRPVVLGDIPEDSYPLDAWLTDDRHVDAAQAQPPLPEAPVPLNLQDQSFPTALPPPSDDKLSTTDSIPLTLLSLYHDYKTSTLQLASLPTQGVSSLPDLPPTAMAEAQREQTMSKAQHRLTAEEGLVWESLARMEGSVPPSLIPRPPSLPYDPTALETLVYQSSMMSESFQRRVNIPTTSTYDESKEILLAMGVPCIESTGAVEAEALASAMVLSGLADYVVSEDTDVLVYEAPLVRNITSQSLPLTLTSGAELRSALSLSRDAYIDFLLLLGTDFSQRIRNLGPARAYKFIQEYGSIERVVEAQCVSFPKKTGDNADVGTSTRYALRMEEAEYLRQVEVARKVFRTLPEVPVQSEATVVAEKRDDALVVQIMQRCGLGRVLVAGEDWDYGAALAGNYFEDNPGT